MEQKLDEFIKNLIGTRMFFDSRDYLGECTQIVKKWAQINGWPIPNSGGTNKAADYKNFSNGYQFIENTPTNVPNKGDIVVWGKAVGSFGHVAIFVAGNDKNFISFDQNWPQGSAPHTQDHSYFGVSGWLHPNAPKPPEPPQTAPTHRFDINLTPGLINDNEVRRMQTRLKQLGFFPNDIDITGNYKSITKNAVFELQKKFGIISNPTDYGAGYFGPRTREVLNTL